MAGIKEFFSSWVGISVGVIFWAGWIQAAYVMVRNGDIITLIWTLPFFPFVAVYGWGLIVGIFDGGFFSGGV